MKDLTNLFNAAHMKKQVLRSFAYDNLLDHITEQMAARIVQRGDQFSNKDLLDYANSITSSLEKAHKQISGVNDSPVIQLNQQNNVVVNNDVLDEESKKRVEEVINNILKNVKNTNTIESENLNIEENFVEECNDNPEVSTESEHFTIENIKE